MDIQLILNQQICKAMKILIGNDLNATISYGSIISQVKTQVHGLKFLSMPKKDLEYLIRKTVYKMRVQGLIGYKGFNKYCLPLQSGTYNPNIFPNKPDPDFFKVPSKKNIPENTTNLNPANRKRRDSKILSDSSLSGNEIERKRKEFHGIKKIKKNKFNPQLPGARQGKIFREVQSLK